VLALAERWGDEFRGETEGATRLLTSLPAMLIAAVTARQTAGWGGRRLWRPLGGRSARLLRWGGFQHGARQRMFLNEPIQEGQP